MRFFYYLDIDMGKFFNKFVVILIVDKLMFKLKFRNFEVVIRYI